MHDAVQRCKSRGSDFARESLGGAVMLDVTNEDRLARELVFKGLLSRLGTHTINDTGTLLFQCLRNVPRDALSVGNAKDEEGFSAELKKIRHVNRGNNYGEFRRSGTKAEDLAAAQGKNFCRCVPDLLSSELALFWFLRRFPGDCKLDAQDACTIGFFDRTTHHRKTRGDVFLLHFDECVVAGINGAAEAYIGDLRHEGNAFTRFRASGSSLEGHKECAGLEDRFAKQDAGRDGRFRIMALVEEFLRAPSTTSDQAVRRFGYDVVDKEKRRTMRDEFGDGGKHGDSGGNGRGLLSQTEELFVDLVGNDDTVIDGAKPAGHDDTHRTGVVKARQFVRQVHRHF